MATTYTDHSGRRRAWHRLRLWVKAEIVELRRENAELRRQLADAYDGHGVRIVEDTALLGPPPSLALPKP